MKSFLAKSDRQLGICIRMLNDEGFYDLLIHSEKNAKNRMEILVYIKADEDTYERLLNRYLTLICGNKSYPECCSTCPVEQGRIKREQKLAQEKIAKHKVEIDILAGLVRDGLLKVEDAAPRVEMTVEEFEAAMKD